MAWIGMLGDPGRLMKELSYQPGHLWEMETE